jgi:hydrogenase nickel incorporation protein HypA/HybF
LRRPVLDKLQGSNTIKIVFKQIKGVIAGRDYLNSMHEYSVTEHLLNTTLKHAEKAMASRVVKVDLVIGDLTGFMDESIRFYFDILSEGTKAEKAVLEVARIPIRARCGQCLAEFTPGKGNWHCPLCGGPMKEIISGREFYVESIEVE